MSIPAIQAVLAYLNSKTTPPVPAPAGPLALVASEEREVSNFVADLEAALRDINAAVKKGEATNKEVSDLKDKLEKRGWFGAMKAGITGSSTQELTTQVLALSNSIGVTQQVVRVMLKVQTQKNRLLHAFNAALTDKISRIEGDTRTLDSNQKGAALAFLGELQQQVEDQIQQQHLVQSHDDRLRVHDQDLFEAANAHAESVRRLDEVQANFATERQRVDAIGQQLGKVAEWQLDKDKRDADSARQMALAEAAAAALAQRLVELDLWRLGKDSQDAALAAGLKERIGGLESRIVELEASARHARSIKMLFLRQVPALVALGLALTTLLRSLGKA
ncbi:hypothetical protein HHL11_11860 [Ramlibacter sp. G-1-2-2]|uniref:Uncharacterized protein n=1 Tax=Ramlibacter agri TaxID=2728837 RepID=A0A848H5D3_9BURK|nr:hypothetical protein [Ramlibacter agri]NML44450.1 hypothetical protein [Ramlibacter agri]